MRAGGQRQHRGRRHARATAPPHQRGEAVPHRLRRLDRDLLADDGARQRGEGVAAALQPRLAELRDQLLHHAVAPRQVLAGVVPVVGRDARADGARRAGMRHRSGLHPGGALRRVLQHDALRGQFVADAVGRARSRVPSWRRRARRCAAAMRGLVQRRAALQVSRAAAAAARPASRPGPCSSAAGSRRARAVELAGQFEQHGHAPAAC